PHTVHAAFDAAAAGRLTDLLHRSPREFGHPTSLWTLDLAAETAHAAGLTATRVTGETVRATLARHKVHWKRAKRWITSPDPAYRRKKKRPRPPDPADHDPPGLGARLRRRGLVEPGGAAGRPRLDGKRAAAAPGRADGGAG